MPDLDLSTALVNPSTPVLPLPFQVVVHAQLVEVCVVVIACAEVVWLLLALWAFGREEWRSYRRRRAVKLEVGGMGPWETMANQKAYADTAMADAKARFDQAPDMTKVSSDPRGEITDARSAIHRGRL